MRVNPNPTTDLLEALSQARREEQQAILELSSGRKVNVPSDDPAAAAMLVANHDQATLTDRYRQSLESVQGQLQMADSTLSSIESALQRAISLGIEAANGTLSDGDRAAVASELQNIQSAVLALSNTTFQGRYLFAGTAINAAPFSLDSTQTSGIRYNGNDAVNQVTIGDGNQLAVNQPGSRLFVAPGHDMFLALTNMVQATQANTGFDAAVGALRDAFDHVAAQRVFYGNAMNQAQSQSTYLSSVKLQLSQQENTLGGVELEVAATRLVNAQNATNATLAAMGRVSQMNLFDFLK